MGIYRYKCFKMGSRLFFYKLKNIENKLSELPKRKPTRLKGYDYSTYGAYFITICVKERKKLLSEIIVGQGLAPAGNKLTLYGNIVKEQIDLLEIRYKGLKIENMLLCQITYIY